jgi:tripartite-type tricarboxylate transporter receptor subunit TctC
MPTVAETLPGFNGAVWYGLLAPAGTPAEVISRVYDAVVKTVERPAIKKAFNDLSSAPASSTPEAFAQIISGELAQWTRIVRESGAKFE